MVGAPNKCFCACHMLWKDSTGHGLSCPVGQEFYSCLLSVRATTQFGRLHPIVIPFSDLFDSVVHGENQGPGGGRAHP